MGAANTDAVSRSVGLLVSLLVRFPEIATLRYDQRRASLRFRFLVTGILAPDEHAALSRILADSLAAFHRLERRPMRLCTLTPEPHGDLTLLELVRDVGSLSPEEVTLVIELLNEHLGTRLVVDTQDLLQVEDAALQEELIQESLQQLRTTRAGRNLIAVREEGRVMVFNK